MKTNRSFFQDFLFEDLPFDSHEYPIVEMITIKENSVPGKYQTVLFSKLLVLNKREEWDALLAEIAGKVICILDDMLLKNEELEYFKEFYLRTYYYALRKQAKECYLIKQS